MRYMQKYMLPSKHYVFENKFVEVHAFGKIARYKTHRVKLRIIEYVRFQKHGCGDIQLLANIRKVRKKLRISKFFVAFVGKLFCYFAVGDYLRPNSEHIIIILRIT